MSFDITSMQQLGMALHSKVPGPDLTAYLLDLARPCAQQTIRCEIYEPQGQYIDTVRSCQVQFQGPLSPPVKLYWLYL